MKGDVSKKKMLLYIGLALIAFVLIVAGGWFFLTDQIASAVDACKY